MSSGKLKIHSSAFPARAHNCLGAEIWRRGRQCGRREEEKEKAKSIFIWKQCRESWEHISSGQPEAIRQVPRSDRENI